MGTTAQVHLSSSSSFETEEKRDRFEDALFSAKAAVESGIVPGGGCALLRAALRANGDELLGDERIGFEVLRESLKEPVRRICGSEIVVQKLVE